ncbi:MAG: phospho-N-acetylmuramoyl-pentapeptide-transferase [Candidatus Omnitrophota bacterium]
MLYHLFYHFHDTISFFNLFRYITFRAGLAALTAFLISLIFGPWVIRKLTELKIGEKIAKGDSLKLDELHRDKHNTPTMGGILIIGAIVTATCLWADIFNKYIILVLFSTLWLGAVGFIDDYIKVVKKNPKGLRPKVKLFSQILLGTIIWGSLHFYFQPSLRVDVPFLKETSLYLDGFYVLFVILVIAGSSNAVNLTDGLDGLAIGIVVMVAIAFSVLCYVTGNLKFSNYLLIPYLPGSGELTIFCSAMLGAGLGFLWFNCYPASVFMGDVGSLALGGAIGTVALLIRKELLLILVGGIFVAEALSVILQVGSFKLTKKRIFKIAPLHHHFQFLNWPENKVIVRFWIIAGILALLTIITLKIR